jgi:hypothetical protein
MRGFRVIVFAISVALGLYLLNSAFVWVEIPNGLLIIETWIDAAAGIFLIILSLSYMMSRGRQAIDYMGR